MRKRTIKRVVNLTVAAVALILWGLLFKIKGDPWELPLRFVVMYGYCSWAAWYNRLTWARQERDRA